MKKAIVLLSGGQDSTTCLFWAAKEFGHKNIVAIGFDYGQKHRKELDMAHELCTEYDIRFKVFDVKGTLGGSALTDHSKDVSAAHDKAPHLPSSFTAGRNALFLTIAASFGFSIDAFDIVTGTCQTDYSGYPDCRRVFIDAQQTTLSLALDKDIRIHTPLMYLTKAETWKLAADIEEYFLTIPIVEIIRTRTLTDYNGDTSVLNDWGYGKEDNPASILRAKGYREAVEKGWIKNNK